MNNPELIADILLRFVNDISSTLVGKIVITVLVFLLLINFVINLDSEK